MHTPGVACLGHVISPCRVLEVKNQPSKSICLYFLSLKYELSICFLTKIEITLRYRKISTMMTLSIKKESFIPPEQLWKDYCA